MAPIQVFVFMDFGCKRGNPEILTEVCLLAVPRDQYLQPNNIVEPPDKLYHKFDSSGFNMDVFNAFDKFINRQQKPVCLVSHNGVSFDFQILKRELEKLNVSLSDDLLCADGIYAFYDILKDGSYERMSSVNRSCQISDVATTTHADAELCGNITDDKKVTEIQGCDLNEVLKNDNLQVHNEKTPEKQIPAATDKPIKNQSQNPNFNYLNPGNARRRLSFDENYTYSGRPLREWFAYDDPHDCNRPSYKLWDIYNRIVKHPPVVPHPAKEDVYMKFRISHKLGKRFLAWTDQIQLKLVDVDKREIVFD